MADSIIGAFQKGVHNFVDDENIPADAMQDEKNWISQDGRLKLAYGKAVLGNEGTVGKVYGQWFGYKRSGVKVHYRKIGTKIQYLNGSTWTDIITGLTETAEASFANYSSLAGAFTFISCIDGLYKINNEHPASYLSLYSVTKNDKGKILIDKGRMLMWDLANASKTTLKLSWIDAQNSTVYTTVSAEVLGASGATTYNGTLAAKTATRNVFALVVTGTTGAGVETFTDNKDGTLTGSLGGTGTINYTTGVYSVTFNGLVTAGNVTADYQWEDSNIKGVTDFTFSATRVASEGNRITQDIGGDPIVAVLVGQDGAYYSLKVQSAYRLEISVDDTSFTNLVYRRDIGIPFFRAAISTSKGIVFMNTANPDKPELTILQRNPLGDNIEPVQLFPHFDFGLFDWDDCCIDTWNRYITIACKDDGSIQNDRILLADLTTGIIDITSHFIRTFAKDSGLLYGGSSVSENIYTLYNGFDDDGDVLDNFATSKGETYSKSISERLKKFRKLRFKGLIDPDQEVQVYVDYDNSGFELVGTIVGSASYVDYSSPQSIGSNMIGESQIGGEAGAIAYPYFMELKMSTPKFRKRTIKLVATQIGYFDLDTQIDWDILTFEQRIPSRFRQKQNVSLDGQSTDQ